MTLRGGQLPLRADAAQVRHLAIAVNHHATPQCRPGQAASIVKRVQAASPRVNPATHVIVRADALAYAVTVQQLGGYTALLPLAGTTLQSLHRRAGKGRLNPTLARGITRNAVFAN